MSKHNLPEEIWKLVVRNTNAIHTMAIVQEGLIMEIESMLKAHGNLKYEYKQNVNIIKSKSSEMRAAINTANHEDAYAFGYDADLIEDFINNLFSLKKHE
jgi:hypothetical protein